MTINILGKDVVVSYDGERLRDMNEQGEFSGNGCRIILDGTMPRDQTRSVLIHEILEALNWHMEMELPHSKITQLEAGLFQVMKENGGIKWIDDILDKIK